MSTEGDAVAPLPLYRKVADDLRDAIRDGTFAPGAQLPTEQQLRERYQCSRNTVRDALAELAAEGLIETAGRLGTRVRQQTVLEHRAVSMEHPDREGESDSWFALVHAAGREPAQDFSMRIEPASAGVACRLRLDENDLVCVRDCMRYVDGHPWAEQVSYYPMDIAQRAGLLVPHDIPRGTVRALAAAGIVEVGHIDEVSARMPSPEEVRQFQLPQGVPMLLVQRTAWTTDRPVCLARERYAADRNIRVYELGDLCARGRAEEPG